MSWFQFDIFVMQSALLDLFWMLVGVYAAIFVVVLALMWITRNYDNRRR